VIHGGSISSDPCIRGAPFIRDAAASALQVYFDVNTASISAEGNKMIAAVTDMIKKDNVKIAITGHTDKTVPRRKTRNSPKVAQPRSATHSKQQASRRRTSR
jgi:outer membrane protein OmpA-like peptidoglycan-associated protein